jgi:hypothetical protein
LCCRGCRRSAGDWQQLAVAFEQAHLSAAVVYTSCSLGKPWAYAKLGLQHLHAICFTQLTVCCPAFAWPSCCHAVFAYPGGASMEIHQALTRSETIENILCRHEQVRGHEGRTGVVTGVSSAGFCNCEGLWRLWSVASRLSGFNSASSMSSQQAVGCSCHRAQRQGFVVSRLCSVRGLCGAGAAAAHTASKHCGIAAVVCSSNMAGGGARMCSSGSHGQSAQVGFSVNSISPLRASACVPVFTCACPVPFPCSCVHRARSLQLRAMPRPQGVWVCALPPVAQVPPTWSLAWLMP